MATTTISGSMMGQGIGAYNGAYHQERNMQGVYKLPQAILGMRIIHLPIIHHHHAD
jgi:hypothetical protein